MTETARERRRFLQERVDRLGERIDAANRRDEVIRLIERVRSGESPEELRSLPSDDAWRESPPGSQDQLLIPYYVTLRGELALLNGEVARPAKLGATLLGWTGRRRRSSGRCRPWPVVDVQKFGFEILRALGLAFSADDDDWTELPV